MRTAFNELHRAAAQREGIVGSAALLMQGDRNIGRFYQGFADEETKRPIAEETIFHWASCTKTITGITMMQLRDRGCLTLDDPIVKYLPELQQVHNLFGSRDDITLRHLRTHRAGFRASTWPWQTKPWHSQPTHWHQLVAMLPYSEIHFKPGEKFANSNPALIFLRMVMEQLSGDD